MAVKSGSPNERSRGNLGARKPKKEVPSAGTLEACRLLIENMQDGVCVIQDGKICYANEALAAMLGRPQEEAIGLEFMKLLVPEDRKADSDLKRMMAGTIQDPQTYECRLMRKPGRSRASVQVSVQPGSYQGRHALTATIKDISAFKSVLSALTDSERKYRELYDNLRDGFAAVNMEGRIVECNAAFQQMLEYSLPEVLRLSYKDITPKKWHALEQKILTEQVLTRSYSDIYEKEYKRKDGSIFPVELTTYLIRGQKGEPVGMWAFVRDITERKKAEDGLKNSRNALLTVLDSIDATVYVADLKTHEILFANRVMKDVFGPDLEGQICYMVFRGESSPCAHCSNDRLVDARGRPTGVYTWEGFNPIAKRWYMNYDRAIPWVTGQLVRLQVATDITERKKTETAILENEERYRNLFEDSRDAIVVTDGEGFFLGLNKAALDLFGYGEEEIKKKNFTEFYVDPDAPSTFQRDIDEKGSVRDYEAKLFTRDRTEMDCLLSVTAKRASDGSVLRYQGIIRDITEHKRMQGALQESERRYKELSITDDLTGLYNVRHFYAQLKFEADRANRYHRPLSLLMMDLDNFKDYNDRYGHLEGDKALAAWGAVLRNNTRRTDSAYRYGGEEFTLILPETPAKSALVIAERLRMKLKTHALSPVEGEKAQITVSIGISEYVQGEEISELIKRSDRGLYKAKEQGKDQTCSL